MSSENNDGYRWVEWKVGKEMPKNAMEGGMDTDKSKIYVGRVNHKGDMMPAKVMPDKEAAYVSYNMREVKVDTVEILCEKKFSWVEMANGNVPKDAVASGNTENGEPLYVGRGKHSGAITVGKVHPSHKCLYIPYGGNEIKLPKYEVLVFN